ncbi:hypothetical protein IFM89_035496 [Coptis chinensis]|uniref:KIB1-4 beta-propeller domain-containing protein n=1 Tax=Coptis chinensis TaxID=261450 RepID=A0A835HPG1_9MAGN|nr:hypothetical protein IFM89_035496 [Coptis chinensis]
MGTNTGRKLTYFHNLQRVTLSSTATMDDFIIIALHSWKYLVYFRAGDERWNFIGDKNCEHDDLINYKGKFYAVDKMGRTLIVDWHTLSVTLGANTIANDHRKKHLVESNGDLFLVDVHYRLPCKDCVGVFLGCKVFRLDEKERQWCR